MTAPELRPLSFGELLDRSFTYYRRHFWVFVGIMAIPQVFFLAMILSAGALSSEGPGTAWQLFFAVGFVLTGLSWLLAYAFAFGATTFAVSEVHLGRAITIRAAYRSMRGRIGRLLNLGFSVLLRMTACAITIVLLPLAVLMLFWYALAIPALLLENTTARQSLKRSRLLTKGYLDRIFLIGILTGIVSWVGAFVLQGPFWVANLALAFKNIPPPAWLELLTNIAGGLAGAFTGPLMMIALVLVYYDSRVKKEGYDLQLMIETLPAAAPTEAVVTQPTPELKKMSVVLVIGLSLITGMIYEPIWFLTRRKALNRLRSSEKLRLFPFVFVLAVFLIVFLIAFFADLAGKKEPEIFNRLLLFAAAIVLIFQRFKVKDMLLDHFSPPFSGEFASSLALQNPAPFSGLATFFLGICYLQYKINRFLEMPPQVGEPGGAASLSP